MTPWIVLGVLAIALATAPHAAPLSAQTAPPRPAPSPVRLVAERPASSGAIELVLHSERLGRNYPVVVTPPSGDFAARGQTLPAIYVLDGGYGIAGAIGQFLGGVRMMSLAYVVSIGAPDADRIHDFIETPVQRDGATVGGGGAAFRHFLLHELRPYLESRFPLDAANSALFGHSLGGAFAAGVMSRSPDAFSAYVIGSPALWADPRLPAVLTGVASKGSQARVYLSVGEKEREEFLQDFERVRAAVTAAGSAFSVQTRVFAGETHVSYLPQLVTASFSWALPPPAATPARAALSLPPEALDRVVGVYEVEDGRTVTITRSGAQIFSQVSTGLKAPLLAETPSTFFVRGFDYVVTFESPDGAVPTGLVLRMNGAEVRARRR
jgi:predicted alpha/beta superfamily hydrolase